MEVLNFFMGAKMSMMRLRLRLAALGAALVLAACGGGDSTPEYTSMVSFGDSLSDVGTYKVGTVAAVGGGKFTVNSSTAQTWTEILASNARTPAPCAAQTGLLPNIAGLTGAPVTNVAGCRNYAQGSSRVSLPHSINSASLQAAPFNQMNIGLMAVPITTQMNTHLANVGGAYSGNELVTVLAGGNDLFMHLNGISSAAAGGAAAVGAALAAGWPADVQAAVAGGGAAASNAAVNAAVTGMGQAGAQLATLVKTQVLGKGARFVVVVNLPDVSLSPLALARGESTRTLMSNLTTVFNNQLQSGLAGATGVVLVDAYTQGRLQASNPAQFGIGNLTTPACSTASPNNPLQGSALACTPASTVTADTSGFAYADDVHPTPLSHRLLADHVTTQLRAVGWL
jgi:outer membrane lipase/esterase